MEYLDILLSIDQSEFLKGTKFNEEDITVTNFKKGDIIYDEINGVSSIALIHKGEVSVLFTGDDDKKITINTLKPGSCFGISNLLFKHKLDTTLECKGDVTIIYIPKEIVVKAMESDAKLAMRYGAHCNEKISFLLGKIEFFTIHNAREKFIKYLLDNKNGDGIVSLSSTRENLALDIGISRAALYRELKHFQELSFISLNKASILINNESELYNILNQYNK